MAEAATETVEKPTETASEATQGQEQNAPDPLGMSDEDFLNFDPTALDAVEMPDANTGETSDTDSETGNESSADAEDEAAGEVEGGGAGTGEEAGSTEETDTQHQAADETDSQTAEKAGRTPDTETGAEDVAVPDIETEDSAGEQIDYKAEYERILAPFKANGKEIQVDNVDDAITLMRMGANYNKKMQALKPNLRLIKMLDNNDLLDESKLSYLIDLNKKDPKAIQKLIKESGVDPLKIDTEQDPNYQPGTYTVDDKEVELDNVLSDIRESPGFKTTVDVISNKWDEASKKVLVDNPSIIRVLNEHVELGIYDKIAAVVEKERMMGRFTDLSDIQAYKMVGDAINAKGGFKQAPNQSTSSNTNTTPAQDTANTKTADTGDTQRKDRRKSAGFTKSKAAKKGQPDFNPLAMSDEEFERLPPGKYI